jgi:Trk K+ transport system NAD-binding subunit
MPSQVEFSGWHPSRRIAIGDRLLILDAGRPRARSIAAGAEPMQDARWSWTEQLARAIRRWRSEGLGRAAWVALIGLGTLGGLLALAVASFTWNAPRLPFFEALRLSLLLLSGGHLADVFENYDELPGGVHWAEVVLTVSGTILTAVLYALLTDRLLTARFEFLARRPREPSRDHVIVAGLGATGQRVAAFLQQLGRPVVAVEQAALAAHLLPALPVIRGSATDAEVLQRANLATARGLVATATDDLRNVEIALLASMQEPECRVVVRTLDPRFYENAASLLPSAKVLCVSSLAATAFAAAALGEHVINLFQMRERPVLVLEYRIETGDTLEGRALWEVAEGYAVVPVLYEQPDGAQRVCTTDDGGIRLQPGDRLVVLTTAESLGAIERGALLPREYELRLLALRPYAEVFHLVGVLAQRLDYTLEQAREALAHLPHRVPQRLYALHALRTERLLESNGVEVSVERVAVAD